MKNIIKYCFVLTILFVFNKLEGQISEQFIENEKEFLIRYQQIGGSQIMEIKKVGPFKTHKQIREPYYYWKSFTLRGDTVIDGVKYKIIERRHLGVTDTIGFILENNTGEVIILSKNMKQLNSYNFNLAIGDTLNYKIVSKIDTISNSGHSRIRYNFKMCCSDDDPEVLISGLGDMMNVILPNKRYTTCNCYPREVTGDAIGGKIVSKLVRVKVEDKIVYLDKECQNAPFKDIDKEVSGNKSP